AFYRRTWYVRRLRASLCWREANRARARGDEATALREYGRAATWYSRALRARPKIRLFEREGLTLRVYQRFDSSPILFANAHDAHREARHRLRAGGTNGGSLRYAKILSVSLDTRSAPSVGI